ncbi:MAG: hypothetical protein KDA84_02365 [Planctomycetaceae bacterium]|nr:hypothetical protein [Planctomycetaceae bacterium]
MAQLGAQEFIRREAAMQALLKRESVPLELLESASHSKWSHHLLGDEVKCAIYSHRHQGQGSIRMMRKHKKQLASERNSHAETFDSHLC